MSSNLELRKVRDFGDILNTTFLFIKQNFVTLAKHLLLIAGPFLVLAAIVTTLLPTAAFSFEPNPDLIEEIAEVWWVYILILGLNIVASSLGTIIVYGFVDTYLKKGPGAHSLEETWRQIREYGFGVIGIFLVFFIGAILGGTIVLIPCLGILLYFLGLAHFGIRFSLTHAILITEGCGVFMAFQRSATLVKGQWWPTFFIVAVTMICYAVLSGVFSLPAIIVGFVYGMNSVEGGNNPVVIRFLMAFFGVINGLGTTLLYTIPLVAIALQYLSLAELRERLGLKERIRAMTESVGTDVARGGPRFREEERTGSTTERPEPGTDDELTDGHG